MKKMKSHIAIVILFAGLLLPMVCRAQVEMTLYPEYGARVSLSADKRLVKGLHVSLEEEVRFDDNFRGLNRLQTTLGLNYKAHRNLKLGVGYALINLYGKRSFKNARHRFLAEVTGMLHLGNWNLSLKERFQATCRTGEFNVYQNPRTALTLKSRLTGRYKGIMKWEPYAYVEVRHWLNAPVVSDDHLEMGEPGWFLEGFSGTYLNRWRGCLGVDYKLNKNHTLNCYVLGDYVIDKVVDANADGTILKSYTKETGFKTWLGAGYEFAF